MGTCKQGEYPLMVGKEAKKMKLETLNVRWKAVGTWSN